MVFLRLITQVQCNKFNTCSLLTPEIFYFLNNLQIFTTDLQKHSMMIKKFLPHKIHISMYQKFNFFFDYFETTI